jgi:hypothetical protein
VELGRQVCRVAGALAFLQQSEVTALVVEEAQLEVLRPLEVRQLAVAECFAEAAQVRLEVVGQSVDLGSFLLVARALVRARALWPQEVKGPKADLVAGELEIEVLAWALQVEEWTRRPVLDSVGVEVGLQD